MQTPFEASSAITVTSSSGAQAQTLTQPVQAGGLFSWFSNSSLVHRVVEKTKVTSFEFTLLNYH